MNKQKIKQPKKKKKTTRPRKSDQFIVALNDVSKRPKLASITLGKRLLNMLSSCRNRDKEKGRENYLTIDMLREEAMKAVGKKCPYCNELLDHKNISMDHILPLSRGGESRIENIQFTCLKCNKQKDKMLDNEFKAFKNLLESFSDESRLYVNQKMSMQGGKYGFYQKKSKSA